MCTPLKEQQIKSQIMITIAWHWLVYIAVLLAGIAYLIFGENEYGDYVIPFRKPLVFIGLVVYTLVWGGFFWW